MVLGHLEGDLIETNYTVEFYSLYILLRFLQSAALDADSSKSVLCIHLSRESRMWELVTSELTSIRETHPQNLHPCGSIPQI